MYLQLEFRNKAEIKIRKFASERREKETSRVYLDTYHRPDSQQWRCPSGCTVSGIAAGGRKRRKSAHAWDETADIPKSCSFVIHPGRLAETSERAGEAGSIRSYILFFSLNDKNDGARRIPRIARIGRRRSKGGKKNKFYGASGNSGHWKCNN